MSLFFLVHSWIFSGQTCRYNLFIFFLYITFIGVTLVNKIIQVSDVCFYNTSSAHCTVCSPPQMMCPSITIYPPYTLLYCPTPPSLVITSLLSVSMRSFSSFVEQRKTKTEQNQKNTHKQFFFFLKFVIIILLQLFQFPPFALLHPAHAPLPLWGTKLKLILQLVLLTGL